MRAAIRLLALLLVAVPGALRADEIGDQLDQARQYYDEGDLTGAIGELEFVLQALRGRVAEALAATFPAPLPGWTVEAKDDQGGGTIPFVGGNMVGRTYRAPDGELFLKIKYLRKNQLFRHFLKLQ